MVEKQKTKCVVAVDAMGGDFAPRNEILGAIEAYQESGDFDLLLVGRKEAIIDEINSNKLEFDQKFIIQADEVIDMHDHPTETMKTKPNSSMAVGAKLVRSGEAHAFVSTGNTGAMVVNSIFGMGRIKGVSRPTLTAPLPNNKGGFTFLADVGAFVDSKPQHIFEFALLSNILIENIYGINNPRVGILNVGEEESKGFKLIADASKLLKESKLNFVGNIEGNDIFKGTADLVVCDGFIGNIVLKFAESIIPFLKSTFKNYADLGFSNKLKIGLVKGPLKEALKNANPDNLGGLPLLGVDGISIIGHGSSSPLAIKNMVLRAKEMYDKDIVNKIKGTLADYAEYK